MERIKPRTLSGFMELLPERQIQFDMMVEKLRGSFSLYGFTPLDTPIIESAEVLLAKGGGETEKQVYRFMKGDNDLALRFDLTVPLAKYVALNYGRLSFPFRRFQIGKVYRGERAQRGRFREFYQADIDIIGDGALDIINDAEILGVIYCSFNELGLKKFVIRINNRKALNGLFSLFDLTYNAAGIMNTIDKIDKIGAAEVGGILVKDLGVDKNKADEILELITCDARGENPIEVLTKHEGKNEILDAGIQELRAVTKYLPELGVPETHFAVDLTIARGLDYYTGTVYETVMTDHPEIGSICSGGRYDNLAEYYTAKKLPGVGISIGLTRLFYVLEEQGYLNSELLTSPADTLILPMTEDLKLAVSLATALRDIGVRTYLNCEEKKFKAKVSYADKLGIPYVVFIGEDEIKEDRVTVKKLSTGEQVTTTPAKAIALIKDGISILRGGTPIKG